jgi:hypothetical protein
MRSSHSPAPVILLEETGGDKEVDLCIVTLLCWSSCANLGMCEAMVNVEGDADDDDVCL